MRVTYQVTTQRSGGRDRQVIAEYDNKYDATQRAVGITGRGLFVSVVRVERVEAVDVAIGSPEWEALFAAKRRGEVL